MLLGNQTFLYRVRWDQVTIKKTVLFLSKKRYVINLGLKENTLTDLSFSPRIKEVNLLFNFLITSCYGWFITIQVPQKTYENTEDIDL